MSPEAYLKMLRIEDLEAKVEELAGKVDKLENPKMTLLESTVETTEPSKEGQQSKDEPTWEGWITNRPPTEEDSDDHGEVAIFEDSCKARSVNYDYREVADMAIPWTKTSQAEQFTVENPAPLPYNQEVSA